MLKNVEILGPGILVYRDVFDGPKMINDLESVLSKNDSVHSWSAASTGYSNLNKKYRDCQDFKIKVNGDTNITLGGGSYTRFVDLDKLSDDEKILKDIYEKSHIPQIEPVEDYRRIFNIAPLTYWESFNFVKYGPDQHFQIHSDHGYSYICVLSSVGYLNDDYEGGELYFDKFDIKIKPKAGDLYLFPSSFIYSHAAMPVTSGTKYSIVTMLDYFEAAHTPEYRKIESRYIENYL
jgi:hypothetical protein